MKRSIFLTLLQTCCVVFVAAQNSQTIQGNFSVGRELDGAAQHRFNVWQSHGPTYDITSLAIAPSSPNTLIAAGGDYCCGWSAYKTTNYGFNWLGITPFQPVPVPDALGPVAIDPTDARVFYIYRVPGVFKTTNGGQSWNLVLPNWVSTLEVAPSDRNIIYAMGGEVLYVSTNGGASWITRQLPLPGGAAYGTLSVHPNDPNTLFAAMENPYVFGRTYKSIDGGLNWSILNIPMSGSIYIDPRNPNIIYATAGGLRKSVDGGSTWTQIPTPHSPNTFVLDTRRNTLYIGTEIYGVYKSSNDGASWQAFNNGLPTEPYTYIYELVMDEAGGILHAGTSCCVFSVRVIPSSKADFDGDGRADIAVFRPSDRTWYLNQSTAGFSAVQFGLSSDKLTPADYDGDGKTDISIFREGVWYRLNSSNQTVGIVQFGLTNDIPVPADYTGDGRTEIAVYRGGVWWTLNLAANQVGTIQFGLSTDKPAAADYDGDGRADQAIYRNGEWHLNRSTQGYTIVNFGLATDKLVVGDYDGDSRTDLAVFRPSTAVWYILRSSDNSVSQINWGIATDKPVAADYDGDGRTDIAVYRNGNWYIVQSSNGSFNYQQFGLSSDFPIAGGN